MKSYPTVSVIMAAYKAESTITDAVESVLRQTFGDLELIVCDDASDDGTLAQLSCIKDSRLHVLSNHRNLGPGPSRDKAISEATGRWLAFIDADDAWDQNRLAALLTATQGDSVLVFDDILECHDHRGALLPWKRLRGRHAFNSDGCQPVDVAFDLFVRQQRLLIKPLFPRQAVIENRIVHNQSAFGEDSYYFLRILATGLPIRYLPQPLYHYRLRPGSATANPARHRLMRQSVEQALVDSRFDEAQRKAVLEKIEQLRRNEVYSSFREHVLNLRTQRAIALFIYNPSIAVEIGRRLLLNSWRRLSRKAHAFLSTIS